MPIKMSKYWNSQEIVTIIIIIIFFLNMYFLVFESLRKKIVLVFQVIGKQGPFIAVRIIKHESFIRNLNEKYLT